MKNVLLDRALVANDWYAIWGAGDAFTRREDSVACWSWQAYGGGARDTPDLRFPSASNGYLASRIWGTLAPRYIVVF